MTMSRTAPGFSWTEAIVPLRWTILIMAVAFVLFAAMVVFDLTDWSSTLEESLKLLSDVFIALYAARVQLQRGRLV